ncbi:MAG: hypothetical protein NTZ05_03850 [Chloroflexi bacterium]|nr:hypothetical protein [Chloroflexota bacterium]
MDAGGGDAAAGTGDGGRAGPGAERRRRLNNARQSAAGEPYGACADRCANLLGGRHAGRLNQGHNTTNEIYISGTVGAALHARWLGIPAISLSVFQLDSTHQPIAAKLAAILVRKMQEGLIPMDVLYNCNVPHKEMPEVEGLEITRLGLRNFADVVDVQDTRGRKTYWLQRKRTNVDIEEGTDFYALTKARIAITPLDNHLNAVQNVIHPELAAAILEEMRAVE